MVYSFSCAARRLVARVDLLDRLAGGLPFRIAPFAPIVEIAAGRQRIGAVHRDGLAGEPVAAVGEQEGREILQLLHAAAAVHRVRPRGAARRHLDRAQALARAFSGNFAGRDRVEPDALAEPGAAAGDQDALLPKQAVGEHEIPSLTIPDFTALRAAPSRLRDYVRRAGVPPSPRSQ